MSDQPASQVEFRAVERHEREECLSLWKTVWRHDSDNYFGRYLYKDVDWLPYYTQAAFVDGKIVSAVQICKRIVACGEFRLTMGGIANVATLEEYRGRGHNAECLRRAVHVMEADAMDFSLLFTGIHEYYEKQGYSVWHRKRVAGRIRSDAACRLNNWAIAPVRYARSEDLSQIEAIHATFNHERPIAVLRSSAYWRDWIGSESEAFLKTTLTAQNDRGDIEAYLRFRLLSEAIEITEFAYANGRDAEPQRLMQSLLLALIDIANENQKKLLQLNLPEDAVMRSLVDDACHHAESGDNRSGMVRLLHRDALFRSLTFEWTERWIRSGRPVGTLRFQTPYGVTEIDAHGSLLEVRQTDETANSFTQSQFFGLLFQGANAHDIAPDAAHPRLVQSLFPSRGGVYWQADGF